MMDSHLAPNFCALGNPRRYNTPFWEAVMAKFNSLFEWSEEIDDPRDNRVRDVTWAQLPDQNQVINEVESFLKFKEKHPHSGSITVSGTVPGVANAN